MISQERKEAMRRLMEETDIADVLNYLGEKTFNKGSAIFIYCPNPEHHDEHPTNCFFRKGDCRVYCTTCSKAYGAADLLQLKTGCSLAEAAKTVWEINGRPAYYNPDFTQSKSREQKFLLTREEQEVLRITLPNRIGVPFHYSDIKYYSYNDLPHGYAYDKNEIDGYLIEKEHTVNLYDFFENEEEFKSFVYKRALEMLKKYDWIQKHFRDKNLENNVEEKKILLRKLIGKTKKGGKRYA